MSMGRRLLISISVIVLFLTLIPGTSSATTGTDLRVYGSTQVVRRGGSVAFQWTVENWGTAPATNVVLVSEFSVPVRLESAWIGSGSCTSSSPTTVVCPLGDLPGNSITARLGTPVYVTPLEYGTVSVTTSVSSDEPDANPADNSVGNTVEISTAEEADVAVEQFTAGHPRTFGPFYAGVPFYYVVDVDNDGPRDAPNTTATVDLADGLVFDEARTTDECSDSAGIVTCNFGTVELETDYILVWVHATEAGSYTTTLSLDSDLTDPVPTNNSDSETTIAEPMADLGATIVESADPAKSGRPLTFTMTVTNNGPSDVPDAKLTHYFSSQVDGFHPMKVDIRSIVPSQGTCSQFDAITVHCQLGFLADGASATVQTTVVPRGEGTLWNNVDAFSENVPDMGTTDNARPVAETQVLKGRR